MGSQAGDRQRDHADEVQRRDRRAARKPAYAKGVVFGRPNLPYTRGVDRRVFRDRPGHDNSSDSRVCGGRDLFLLNQHRERRVGRAVCRDKGRNDSAWHVLRPVAGARARRDVRRRHCRHPVCYRAICQLVPRL